MLYDSVYHRRVRYLYGRRARSMPLGLFSPIHAHRRASIVTSIVCTYIYRVLYAIYILTRRWGIHLSFRRALVFYGPYKQPDAEQVRAPVNGEH